MRVSRKWMENITNKKHRLKMEMEVQNWNKQNRTKRIERKKVIRKNRLKQSKMIRK